MARNRGYLTYRSSVTVAQRSPTPLDKVQFLGAVQTAVHFLDGSTRPTTELLALSPFAAAGDEANCSSAFAEGVSE